MKYATSAIFAGIIASTTAESTPFSVDGSEVMRAIADANESSAMDKVSEERKIAKRMEGLENQARVNEAINKSTSDEESNVIEAANKRMSEIHKEKEHNANKGSMKIDDIKANTKKALMAANADEQGAISKAVGKASKNVVSNKPNDDTKIKMKSKPEKEMPAPVEEKTKAEKKTDKKKSKAVKKEMEKEAKVKVVKEKKSKSAPVQEKKKAIESSDESEGEEEESLLKKAEKEEKK